MVIYPITGDEDDTEVAKTDASGVATLCALETLLILF